MPRFGLVLGMITPGEIRAARAILGWTRHELADRAVVSLNSVVRLERSLVDSRSSTVAAVRLALEKAGIQFLSVTDGTEGIRLHQRRTRRSR